MARDLILLFDPITYGSFAHYLCFSFESEEPRESGGTDSAWGWHTEGTARPLREQVHGKRCLSQQEGPLP